MNRCTRCVMPETVPGITFDKDGVCDFCRSHKEFHVKGEEELRKIIDESTRRSSKYDCIVPMSGGRDSTFVLYAARKILGLRVLAMSYDNEFRVPQALINMRRACDRLGVDFINVRSKLSFAQGVVRNSLKSAVSFFDPGYCRACEYGYRAIVYREAERLGIPLIFWGESSAEATQDMESKALATIGESRSKLLKLMKGSFYKTEAYALLHRLEFRVPGNSVLHRDNPVMRNERIKEIRLYDYLVWDRDLIKKTIMEDLGWERPQGQKSTWRIDCKLHNLTNFHYFKMIGCSKDCFGYTKMINSGQMDRESALEQEEDLLENITVAMGELLHETVGLSRKETDEILSWPGKI